MTEPNETSLGDERIAIAISVYRPNAPMLQALVAAVRHHRGPLLLHVDGATGDAIAPELIAALRGDSGLTVLQAERNGGIGPGLNRLAAEAERQGCEAIVFFDQDSAPRPDTVRELRNALVDLEARGFRPAVVGPAPIADAAAPTKLPRYRTRRVGRAPPAYRATDYIITSGSLMTLAALRDVGAFDAAYRMDAIDVEWCFRAWSKGYTVWCVPGVTMRHRIGEGIVALSRLRFPLQSATRMQSYARNQFHLLRLGHVPLKWKLRTLVYVPLQIAAFVAKAPSDRPRLARQLLRSVADGLAARFEPWR